MKKYGQSEKANSCTYVDSIEVEAVAAVLGATGCRVHDKVPLQVEERSWSTTMEAAKQKMRPGQKKEKNKFYFHSSNKFAKALKNEPIYKQFCLKKVKK